MVALLLPLLAFVFVVPSVLAQIAYDPPTRAYWFSCLNSTTNRTYPIYMDTNTGYVTTRLEFDDDSAQIGKLYKNNGSYHIVSNGALALYYVWVLEDFADSVIIKRDLTSYVDFRLVNSTTTPTGYAFYLFWGSLSFNCPVNGTLTASKTSNVSAIFYADIDYASPSPSPSGPALSASSSPTVSPSPSASKIMNASPSVSPMSSNLPSTPTASLSSSPALTPVPSALQVSPNASPASDAISAAVMSSGNDVLNLIVIALILLLF